MEFRSLDYFAYIAGEIIYKTLMQILIITGNKPMYISFRDNVITLGKYLTKYNYKEEFRVGFIEQFMDIQEKLIIDNELDQNKRRELEMIMETIILDLNTYSSVLNENDYFNSLTNETTEELLSIYSKIFKEMTSDNYLTEIELDKIIKLKGK